MIMINDTAPQFDTVRDVARILKVTRSTAYRMVKRGIIPSVKLGGAVRVPRSFFDAIANKAVRQATTR